MFKFHFVRSMRDVLGHVILVFFPILLIAFFNYILSETPIASGAREHAVPPLSVLTLGFALTFQIYGASVGFESLGADFFTPMRDRLIASPAEPRSLVISALSVGCIVSFLQTVVVLTFSNLALGAELGSLHLILPILFLSVIFNQFLGTAILISTESVKTSITSLTIYGAVVPMSVGLYFPLPQNAFFDILRRYLTPLALANTAVLGVLEGNTRDVIVGAGALAIMSCGLFLALRPLIRRLST